MNELTLLNKFIIDRFDLNPLVNTISIVPTLDIDGNKENIFPLVNIDLRETEVLTDAIVGSYRITVLNQRDIKPIKTDSKLLDNTNFLDNANETHAIASDLINYLRWKNNDLVIEIQSLTKLQILKNWSGNGLDGVQFDIDLSIYNRGLQND